jgi:uroporphyrin-III C-methyltransferase
MPRELAQAHARGCEPGRVHLVGAGPGAAELLTVRAVRLLTSADVVFHDQLVTDEVLALAGASTELLPVGRRHGRVLVDHADLIDQLATAAHAGRRVVRLKGGDPVVFGRGGEEVADLAARGVPTELVPGVTSAIAGPELAGIPVTHRGLAGGLLVLTARRATNDSVCDADLEAAARFSGTVVVLMGTHRLGDLCDDLVRHGRAPTTPAAVVSRASLPDQQVVAADLARLPDAVADAEPSTPALLVVGEVVALRAHAQDGSSSRSTSTAACL